MMDHLLADVSAHTAAYLDDVIIHSATWPDHLRHLRVIFEKFRGA